MMYRLLHRIFFLKKYPLSQVEYKHFFYGKEVPFRLLKYNYFFGWVLRISASRCSKGEWFLEFHWVKEPPKKILIHKPKGKYTLKTISYYRTNFISYLYLLWFYLTRKKV